VLAMRASRVAWAGGAFALITVLLLAAPLVSAAPPPFTYTPPYKHDGGSVYTGSLVGGLVSGFNKILRNPTFSLKTGNASFSIQSFASTGGDAVLQVWAGVRNISFKCPASCVTGNYLVSVDWNLTWSIHLNTTCGPPSGGSIPFAGTNDSVIAQVNERAKSTLRPSPVVGEGGIVWDESLNHSGSVRFGVHLQNSVMNFMAFLTSGHSYLIETYIIMATDASASSLTGAPCTAEATASTGVPTHSMLRSISVS
jgi:hypothetical protein